MKQCTKAIIPVAGYGTRRLPITKVIEKCMMPLGNRPVVDYVVQDCVGAGVQDIYFVVSDATEQLKAYYSHDATLEAYLRERGKDEYLADIMPPAGVRFHYVRQDASPMAPYGTAVAAWVCREFISPDEYCLILMGDDVTYNPDGSSDISRLVEAEGAAILGVNREGDLSAYGLISSDERGDFSHIVEDAEPGEEPSSMINVSKYIVPGTFMHYLDDVMDRPAHGSGEYYIIDAVNQFVSDGHRLEVIEAAGEYLDAGSLDAWVAANQYLHTIDKT